MDFQYTPSPFMLPTSHYDAKRADHAVAFIQNLKHTKGKWDGKPFLLLPWQEQIVRDIFGIVKADGKRQFRSAYVEIPKKNGKSELAAAIALYLLYGDGEASAEVYGCANDRSQASIVFDVAKRMVEKCPALLKRSKIAAATKRIVNYRNAGFYQVLSAETGTKHGLNISGLVFDEIHAQPNRKLYDVMTKGSGDAREQPLFFIITTAGTDKESICYELHTKALDIMNGRKADHSFYPVIYGLSDEDDWNDEKNWYKANPSLGYTISIDRVRDAYREALDNPAEENVFKQLRLNIWTNSAVAWIPEHIYDRGNQKIDYTSLLGRDCFAGLDLSSTSDITALVLVFPPRTEEEKYIVLPFFWRHLNGLVRALRLHHEATLVDGGDTPDHAVIIAFLWRRIVLHEHHLRIFLQLQHLVGGKRKLRKLALHHSLKHVCLSRQLLQLGVVYLLRHGVVGCKTNVALLLARLEVGHISTVKQAQHLCVDLVVTHLVEKVYEHAVALTIHMCEFHHRVVGLSQGVATEEIGCLIILRKQGPLLILCHRSQLSEVTNEQKLHAAKRLVATAVMAQHAVHGIEQVGPDHTYFIDNNEVKTAHDLYLLLAKLKTAALQHRRVRHIGGERQLEERVYGHTLSIDGSNACRCEHHVTF